jgi:excisionase family DNA binding protein
MTNPKSETRNPKPNERLIGLLQATPEREAANWFTRPSLAAALTVSVATVDRMVADEEIPRVMVRRRVRFYGPDVVEALRKRNRKWGRKADTSFMNARQEALGAQGQ